jgi:hypothetical protein
MTEINSEMVTDGMGVAANNRPTPVCYGLDWSEGCPPEPGVYLLRIPRGHDLAGLPLLIRLSEPSAYDWFVVTVFRNDRGWLEYISPRDGSTRVLSSEFGAANVWWTKMHAHEHWSA